MDKFISKPYQADVRNKAIDRLQQLYNICFGLTCDDIGKYENSNYLSGCVGQSNDFLGYIATTDQLPQQVSDICDD